MGTQLKVDVGKYTVREGDTPSDIAHLLYGSRHKVKAILDANPGAEFAPGDVIDVPDFTGVVLVARAGEQFPSLFRRAFNNPAATQAAMVEFFKWNGTQTVSEGGEVFFVDMRRKTYGY
jgi:hypothetical protein